MKTEKLKNMGKWVFKNTFQSKAFWGALMLIVAPLTGPLTPGLTTAGSVLLGVGISDKAIKNRDAIKSFFIKEKK